MPRPKIYHGEVKCESILCKKMIKLYGDNKDQKYCGQACKFKAMKGKRKGGKYQ